MKPSYRGIAVALLHCSFVLSVAGKYAVDRQRLPRVWAKAAPANPSLPIRGRYLSLRLLSPPQLTGQTVAFFLPEHVPNPSSRPPDEELWVEVSVSHTGPPRPVRLAVRKNGVQTPLDVR